jgi:hypothetical protein
MTCFVSIQNEALEPVWQQESVNFRHSKGKSLYIHLESP